MNKVQILCFSPTGNTKFLADILSAKLQCSVYNFDEPFETEHLIVMSSIHAFKIPTFLKDKLKNVKKLSIIAVGCNTSFVNLAAGNHLIKYAKKNNIELCNYFVLAMPITIVKKFNVEYGKKIVNESIATLDEIYNNIINEVNVLYKIPFSSKIFSNIHYIENTFVRLFGLELKVNSNCVNCELCVKNCPKKNISIKNKPKFGLNCMMCMKCIYECPQKAIHPRFSKFIEFKSGYNLDDYK